MRIIVCGGRDYGDADTVADALKQYLSIMPSLLVAQGGANGADRLARRWCDRNGVPCVSFNPDWDRFGKSAGPRRNAAMLAAMGPDLLIAFPGGAGTHDMTRRAKNAGVTVRRISATIDTAETT